MFMTMVIVRVIIISNILVIFMVMVIFIRFVIVMVIVMAIIVMVIVSGIGMAMVSCQCVSRQGLINRNLKYPFTKHTNDYHHQMTTLPC